MAKVKCEVSFSGEPDSRVLAFKALWFADISIGESQSIFQKRLPKGDTVTVQVESKKKAVALVAGLRKQGLLASYKSIR